MPSSLTGGLPTAIGYTMLLAIALFGSLTLLYMILIVMGFSTDGWGTGGETDIMISAIELLGAAMWLLVVTGGLFAIYRWALCLFRLFVHPNATRIDFLRSLAGTAYILLFLIVAVSTGLYMYMWAFMIFDAQSGALPVILISFGWFLEYAVLFWAVRYVCREWYCARYTPCMLPVWNADAKGENYL